MKNEFITKEELEKERTPLELWNWLIQKVEQICSNPEGMRAFRLQNDREKLLKKLSDEIAPLAIWGKHKLGNTDQFLLKPVIGNQRYDAKVIDKRIDPICDTYVEITQAHEGEDDYWRRCELLKEGFVYSYAPVIKTGKGKSRSRSIPPETTSVEERVKIELSRILEAAKRKAGKDDYPPNTTLIIFFDDAFSDDATIDNFVREEIMNLDLRFSDLYIVGQLKIVFREYHLVDKVKDYHEILDDSTC